MWIRKNFSNEIFLLELNKIKSYKGTYLYELHRNIFFYLCSYSIGFIEGYIYENIGKKKIFIDFKFTKIFQIFKILYLIINVVSSLQLILISLNSILTSLIISITTIITPLIFANEKEKIYIEISKYISISKRFCVKLRKIMRFSYVFHTIIFSLIHIYISHQYSFFSIFQHFILTFYILYEICCLLEKFEMKILKRFWIFFKNINF